MMNRFKALILSLLCTIILLIFILLSNVNVPVNEVIMLSIYIFSIIPGFLWILRYNRKHNLIKNAKTDYFIYILIILALLILPLLSIFYYINLFIGEE